MNEPITVPLTAYDESYTHQLPLPHLETLHMSPNWGDRCYHQLSVDGLTINAGRQLYPHAGRRFAFLGADNASISRLVIMPERWILRGYNDTAHLD